MSQSIHDQALELWEHNAALRDEIDHWRERYEQAERRADWLALQLLIQKQLTEGHRLLGDANATARDAALRLAGNDAA